MSRNKREGRYYGWAKGHHIRTFEDNRVSSWRAFRVHSERKFHAWLCAATIPASNKEQA